jgi:hypothetical protein
MDRVVGSVFVRPKPFIWLQDKRLVNHGVRSRSNQKRDKQRSYPERHQNNAQNWLIHQVAPTIVLLTPFKLGASGSQPLNQLFTCCFISMCSSTLQGGRKGKLLIVFSFPYPIANEASCNQNSNYSYDVKPSQRPSSNITPKQEFISDAKEEA